jgi:tRNA 5-methylaminomethyl-2-thiouridine biosynthesis bifunctional protein
MTDEASGLDWVDGAPRSRRFDDVYFSAVDGLAESRAVFLQGCGLPQAWSGRQRFTVGELGFGSGLNILALLALWAETRPLGGHLQIFSVEAYPLTRDEAALALSAWPVLAEIAAPLLAAWPSSRPGFHRLDLPNATLDLWIGEAAEGLDAWGGRADAWFLDGFAPSRNPEMWRAELLARLAARSAPGARAATFTVAGAVRRGLAEVGFAVDKRPGFGRKKERLEAVWPGAPRPEPPAPRVTIIGAGIAGAALARAFRALGVDPLVLEAEGAGAGASGNPAALVSPRLDAGGGGVAALHAQAFDRATRLYADETPDAVLARGALQLESGPRDATRFDRIAAWQGFAPETVGRLSPRDVAEALQEAPGPGGLALPQALTLAPGAVLTRWLGPIQPGRVAGLERADGVWRLLGTDGTLLAESEIVCLAAGVDSAALAAVGPLRPVRGQVSVAATALTGPASAWGGYAIAAPGGLLFGATHDRDDRDTNERPEDHLRNLAQLAQGRPALAARIDGATLTGRAAVRAATPDHLPLAGAVPGTEGLFVLTGLGGRGFTLAPLLAEQVAALALGAAPPLPEGLGALVNPARYAGLVD